MNCMQHGVCQSKNPACTGCDWQARKFSPEIDGPYRSQKAQRRAALRRAVLTGLLSVTVLAMATAVVGFSLGYMQVLP